MHVSVWGIIFTKDVHRPYDFHTRIRKWHQYLRLTKMLGRIRVSHDHGDHNFATGIACTRDVMFLSVNNPFIAFKYCSGCDIGCV